MPAWEYKVISREEGQLLTDEQLNKLGEHGLELIAVVPVAREVTEVGKTKTVQTVHYFFKRPKK